jgi:hypothetical protein
MYVQTRTGGWAPHKETDNGKTKTGIQLYTLAQALAKGYVPPKKVEPTRIKTGRSMSVFIEKTPILNKDYVQVGKVVYSDGTEEPLGFSREPSRSLKTYRILGRKDYTATRISKNDKDKWVKVNYRGGKGHASLPLERDSGTKEGFYTSLEMADRLRHQRGELFETLRLFQDHLMALSPGHIEVDARGGGKRKVLEAPKKAPWLQEWFNKRIEETQKYPEMYAFYQTWKNNRFPGDANAFAELREWALQDSHLVKIEDSHRKKWVNRRNDQYKKLAYHLVTQARGGGNIKVFRPELKESGVEADKPDLVTEERASNHRKFVLSAAASTFLLFLKSCASREEVKYMEHVSEEPKPSKRAA